MPEILKLMIKYKTPIIISTKSSLILRDLELINELSKITYVNIACTIITVDDKLRTIIEPGSSSIIDRFKVIDQVKTYKRINRNTYYAHNSLFNRSTWKYKWFIQNGQESKC